MAETMAAIAAYFAEAGAASSAAAGAGGAAAAGAGAGAGYVGAGSALAGTATAGAATAAGTGLTLAGASELLSAGVALNTLTNKPHLPQVAKTIGMPDPKAQAEARRRSLVEQRVRGGRASTVLTSVGDKLGG